MRTGINYYFIVLYFNELSKHSENMLTFIGYLVFYHKNGIYC